MNFGYMFREAGTNLTRNITLTLAAVLTVFVTLAIVGTSVLIRQGAQNMTRGFEGGVEFVVYVVPEATDDQIAQVGDDLNENPKIASTNYVDREEAYSDFQDIFADKPAMLENVRPIDLPTSYEVEPVDKSPEFVQELVDFYQDRPYVHGVESPGEVIKEVRAVTNFVNDGLTVFAIFLLVSSSLLIFNTIRTAMFARRREIEVMKLVGATNWFIRLPFILEGLVQGLIGGVMAIGWVYIADGWLERRLDRSAEEGLVLLSLFTIEPSDVRLASIIVALVSLALSVVSSAVATRRFLSV